MARTVYLDGSRIRDRLSMSMYMNEIFSLPEHFGNTLEDLKQYLVGLNEDVTLNLSHECVQEILANRYAFRVLLVLGRCADANSHLRIRFCR